MSIIVKFMPYIVSLMGLAEQFFVEKPQSGSEKKAFVIQALKTLFGLIKGVSTGSQKETWSTLEPVLNTIIDMTAPLVFPKAKAQPLARDFTKPLNES